MLDDLLEDDRQVDRGDAADHAPQRQATPDSLNSKDGHRVTWEAAEQLADAAMDAAAQGAEQQRPEHLSRRRSSVTATLPKDELAIRKLQARARGIHSRNCLFNGEAALQIHLDAMHEAETPQADTVDEPTDLEAMDQLIGRADRREYLHEVQTKQLAIQRKIDELSQGRWYMGKKQARVANLEIRKLRGELAQATQEAGVIRAVSKRDTSSGVMSASDSRTRRPSHSATTNKRGVASALPLLRQFTKMNSPAASLADDTKAPPVEVRTRLRLQYLNGGIVRIGLIPYFDTRERDAYLASKANDAHKVRSLQMQVAKQSPQGYESALRVALLKTEIWKLDTEAAVRCASELRKDIEKVTLQGKLSLRILNRMQQSMAAGGAKKTEEQSKQAELLRRYCDMINSALEMMMMEAAELRRIGLKKAVERRRRQKEVLERNMRYATTVQAHTRGYFARLEHRRIRAAQQKSEELERKSRERAVRTSIWRFSSVAVRTLETVKKKEHYCTMIQRLFRERKWNQEQLMLADAALAQALRNDDLLRQALFPIRFASQRARLLEREAIHQAHHRANRQLIRRGRFAETEGEREEREQIVTQHAHQFAFAAQKHASEARQRWQSQKRSANAGAQHVRPHPSNGRHQPSSRVRPQTAPFRRPDTMRAAPASPHMSPQPPQERPLSAPHPMVSAPAGPLMQSPRRPLSARPLPARPLSARPPSARARAARLPPAAADPAAELALRRRTWVQTPAARAIVEEATIDALQPALDRISLEIERRGATRTAALSRARRACAPPPSYLPQREVLSKEYVDSCVLANVRMAPRPTSETARRAQVWLDSGLIAAHRKLDNAALAKWRHERQAWIRSSGLRRRVLVEEEDRAEAVLRSQDRDLDALAHRMRCWQREDDAALMIQSAWQQARRSKSLGHSAEVALKIRGIRRLPPAPLASRPTRQRPKPQTTAGVTLYEVDNGIDEEPAEAMVDPSRDLSTVCLGIHSLLDGALAGLNLEAVSKQQRLIVMPPGSRQRARLD